MPTNTPEHEDTGHFAGYDSIDALAAYVFHREGEAGLREVLEQMKSEPSNGSSYDKREMLEDAAYELSRRGLDQVAAVLLDIAPHCPSGIDNIPGWCVNYYVAEERPRWVDWWRSKWIQDREMQLDRDFPKLRRKPAQSARQSQTNNRKTPSHKHN